MTAFVDTNVLVYLFDADAPQKKAAAARLLSGQLVDEPLAISTQVLQEFYVTVTRKLAQPLSLSDARSVLEDLSELELVAVDAGMVFAAAKRNEAMQVSFWDALIIEAALAADCRTLYTEDLQNGQTFDGLEVKNPFAGL
ncbi:MAG: PIN domain-containing protein [Gammaproteobacteria bacterium]|nr:PIN domain-containing protein [Gammaproteobacteria bacterium]